MTAPAPSVIFVEDDDALRASTVQALELEGLAVTAFDSALTALHTIDEASPAVVVSDVRMPRVDGIELFARLRDVDPQIPVIFTTAHGDIDMAVAAMRDGAADFFTKPYAISRLVQSIRRAAAQRALVLENRQLRRQLEARSGDGAIGVSPAAERLHRIIGEVSRTEADLLLAGAPGTGKSHCARLIHERSSRVSRPLVVVDPGIFANEEADLLLYGRDPSVARSRSGLLERANGGTLVLEAIEQIPERAQARLISLLDNRSFHALGAERPRAIDVRIIGTSGQVSASEASEPRMTGGLRSRLSGITIVLPPLADRPQDVPILFQQFVRNYEQQLEREAGELGEPELRHLLTHDWPGNLRELQMYAQTFVLGLTRLGNPDPAAGKRSSLQELVANYEKSLLENALRQSAGNVAALQQSLSIARKTLYDKLARYDLRPADFRGDNSVS